MRKFLAGLVILLALSAACGAAAEGLATAGKLVAHYTFDEGSRAVAKDVSGNNNHGKIHGADTMKITYASYMWKLKNLEEVVKKVADLGFGGIVFLSREEGHMPIVLEIQSADEMDNIRRIIEQNDLDVHLHVPSMPMLLHARKEGKVLLKDMVDYMEGRIRKMANWIISTGKGKVISFDSLGYMIQNSGTYRFDLRLMCDILQIVADLVAPFDMKVAFENSTADREQISLPYELGKTIELINRKNAGILLDIGHANIAVNSGLMPCKNLSEYIKAIPAEIVEIHLHDNHGKKDEHLNPGEGNIDFESVFSALQSVDFKGNITLESAIPQNEKNQIEYINNGRENIEQLLRN